MADRLYRLGYGALNVACHATFRPYFRFRVENRPQLTGPYVLVANHSSLLDPLLLGAAAPRRCVFMMTELYYRSPRTHAFYKAMRSIPVALRGGNRESMRMARATLARGEVLAVFPEGGISRDGALYLGSPGALALVMSEGVPIVPAAIVGAARAFGFHHAFPRPRRVTVRFGDPLDAETLGGSGTNRKQRLAAATQTVMRAIAELAGQTSREDAVRLAREQKAEKA